MLSRAALAEWGRSLLWLTLFAAPVVFSGATLEAFEYPKLALLRAAALLFLAGGALAASRERIRAWPALPRDEVALGVLLSLLSAAVSTLSSLSPRTSFFGAEGSWGGLSTAAAYVVLFFAARALCGDAASARGVLAGAAAGAGVAVAYGLAQLLGFDPLRWRAPVTFSGVSRVFSTQGHPNSLAQLLATALPVTLYLAYRAWRERRLDGAAGWGCVALGGMGLAQLTLSRAGVLAMLAALGVLFVGASLRAPPRRRWLAVAGLLALLVLGVAVASLPEEGGQGLETLWARLTRGGQDGLDQDPRRFLWAAAWAGFVEHPLAGAGLDCFSLVYAPRRSPEAWRAEWGQTPLKAHNQALELLATRGLLGAAAALVAAAGVLRSLVRALRRPETDHFLALAAFAGLAAFGAHNLFHFPTAAGAALALTLAALLSRLGCPPAEEAPAAEPIPVAKTAAVAAVTAAALVLLVLRPLRADALCRAATDATSASPERALASAREAVRLDPGRSLLWQRLAAASQAAARAERDPERRRQLFSDARAAAEEALRRAAGPSGDAHLGTVLAELEREKPPLAERAEVERSFARASQADPHNSVVLVAAATAALSAGDLEAARGWADRCLALYPELAPPRAVLGAAALAAGRRLAASGEKERAREELQRAVLLLREAHAGEWRGDVAARAAGRVNRMAAMRALAALD